MSGGKLWSVPNAAAAIKKKLKRRNAVEPVIGHMKRDSFGIPDDPRRACRNNNSYAISFSFPQPIWAGVQRKIP